MVSPSDGAVLRLQPDPMSTANTASHPPSPGGTEQRTLASGAVPSVSHPDRVMSPLSLTSPAPYSPSPNGQPLARAPIPKVRIIKPSLPPLATPVLPALPSTAHHPHSVSPTSHLRSDSINPVHPFAAPSGAMQTDGLRGRLDLGVQGIADRSNDKGKGKGRAVGERPGANQSMQGRKQTSRRNLVGPGGIIGMFCLTVARLLH
jgi:hypothetical protein